MLTALWWDLRYSLRMLAQRPAFTCIALAALALGIGANSAIFTVVNSVLLRPLRFPKSDQLVFVQERNLKAGFPRFSLSPGNYADFRDHNHSFSGFTALREQGLNMALGTEPERLSGMRVTSEFFDVFGLKPALGRVFRAEEMNLASQKVAVLSYRLWQRRFAGSQAILGQVLKLNQELYTVVGVIPSGFVLDDKTDIFIPLLLDPGEWQQRGGHYLGGIARLKEGVTKAAAQADLNAIAALAEKEHPESNTGWDTINDTLQHTFVGDFENLLWMLTGAVGLVLLIACANVANLLLSRSAARRREIGIRSSLGAGPARIVRQLLTESVLLASGGAAAGLALAWAATKLVSRAAIETLPRASEIAIDRRVMGFTAGLAVATGVLFGIAPAFDLARTNLSSALKEGGHGSTIGFRRNRLRSALVVGEVALVLVLLATSGLLIRSFYNQQRADLGFEPRHEIAHDGLAEREVVLEPFEQLGKPLAERLLVLGLTDGFLEHHAQQHGIVGVVDRFGPILRRVLGGHDIDCNAGRQLARSARQVLVVHGVERDLQVMRERDKPRPDELDELGLRIDSHDCVPRWAGPSKTLLD